MVRGQRREEAYLGSVEGVAQGRVDAHDPPLLEAPAVPDCLGYARGVQGLIRHGGHLFERFEGEPRPVAFFPLPAYQIAVGDLLQPVPVVGGAPSEHKVAVLPPADAERVPDLAEGVKDGSLIYRYARER